MVSKLPILWKQVQLNGAAFGMDYGECLMHGFIFKKSDFYTKVKVSKSVWQKRWLVLTDEVRRHLLLDLQPRLSRVSAVLYGLFPYNP